MCFSCICLFILHALMVVLSTSSWCQGLAAASDCGTPWTFLLTFWMFSQNIRPHRNERVQIPLYDWQ